MLIIVVEIMVISYENSIFIEFTIWEIVKVSENGLYCDCDACSENHVVLCCKILIFDNHNFTILPIHNLILQLWNRLLFLWVLSVLGHVLPKSLNLLQKKLKGWKKPCKHPAFDQPIWPLPVMCPKVLTNKIVGLRMLFISIIKIKGQEQRERWW